MSDLRRLINLINETIADDPALNARIEQQLAAEGYAPEQQTFILDALDALKMAPNGLTAQEWFDKVRELHKNDPDDIKTFGDAEAVSLLKSTIRQFKYLLKRTPDGRFAYEEQATPDGNLDGVDPQLQTAVQGQVGLTYTMLDRMRGMGVFNTAQLTGEVARLGLPREAADAFARHLITQFSSREEGGMLQQVGPDQYRVTPATRHTNDDSMNLLRDIANKASGRN